MTFSKKTFFSILTANGSSNYELVTLPNFAKFHLQTTEIQPFKFECFSTKTLKFQHDDVIIFDVSGDFGIFFGMWNRLVMSYLCAKFCCDTTLIACNTFIFHVYFCIFPQINRGFSVMTSLSMTSQSLSACECFSVRFCPSSVPSFVALDLQTKGGGWIPPPLPSGTQDF